MPNGSETGIGYVEYARWALKESLKRNLGYIDQQLYGNDLSIMQLALAHILDKLAPFAKQED